ncbi:MAG TPA: helix-turn-helix domain-containing protein [Dermatophilaceae bacterium]|nr:helix-turn-helix domain-containing protein [Dermatophilaceae bacterium]
MPEPVKRPYRSDVRERRAAATRLAIRESATGLFVRCGYAGTSLRDVADGAGVAERTLYKVFPTKIDLFRHVLGVAIGGDEGELHVHEREQVRAVLAEPDPEAVLARTVDLSGSLLDRAAALIMVGVEAAGSDPELRAMSDAGAKATYAGHLAVAKHLASLGALRPALSSTTAADVLYALASPFTHQLLRRDRRWSSDRYRRWLLTTLTSQLLHPDN